jgi:hypothetical protein
MACPEFWSLFKWCIHGTHVSIEPYHLFRYLDSETFWFNNRKVDDDRRFVLGVGGITDKRLTYKSLIGETEEPFPSDNDEESATRN